MSKRDSVLLIEDILEAIEKIENYTGNMRKDAFVKDNRTTDAVARNLEIIGEAANRLPEDFKRDNQNIEWAKIVGLRHRIVHDYFGIDLDIVWQIILQDLPRLKSDLNACRTCKNQTG